MKNKKFVYYIILLFECLVVFCITALIVKKHCTYFTYTDFYVHTETVQELLNSGLRNFTINKVPSYPLWHMLTFVLGMLANNNGVLAAMTATGIFNVISMLCVYKYYSKDSKRNWRPLLITLCLFIMGPFYLPFYNVAIFEGQGSPNIWHNPTHICARTFMILIWIMLVGIINKINNNERIYRNNYIVLAILILLGELAKPSTTQIIVPGIICYVAFELIINKPDKSVIVSLNKILLCCVPALLLLPIEFVFSFASNQAVSEGAVIAPFAYLEYFTPNIAISFILGYTFPLYVFIAFKKFFKDVDVKLSLFIAFVGYVEAIMFAEVGERFIHGNFMWGHYLAMFLVYMVCTKKFFIDYPEIKKKKCLYYVGCGLFVFQTFVGIYYLDYLFTTNYTI